MDIRLLRIFQEHVLQQCDFMLFAAEDVNAGLNTLNSKRTFYALQNLLNACANVSKTLWGQKSKHADARKTLRDSIGVPDDSPLRSPDMRNNFEHLDERLDKWWRDSKSHEYLDFNIGPKVGAIEDRVADPKLDCFRSFDPVTTDLLFWGDEFNIQSLVNEVHRILPKLRAEAGKPPWEEEPPA